MQRAISADSISLPKDKTCARHFFMSQSKTVRTCIDSAKQKHPLTTNSLIVNPGLVQNLHIPCNASRDNASTLTEEAFLSNMALSLAPEGNRFATDCILHLLQVIIDGSTLSRRLVVSDWSATSHHFGKLDLEHNKVETGRDHPWLRAALEHSLRTK